MTFDVDFGVLLPARKAALGGWRTRDLIDVARRAEQLGFASVWSGDSIARSRVAPLPLLGAVAAVTERGHAGYGREVPLFAGARAQLAQLEQLVGLPVASA
jgi:hypothetical protein